MALGSKLEEEKQEVDEFGNEPSTCKVKISASVTGAGERKQVKNSSEITNGTKDHSENLVQEEWSDISFCANGNISSTVTDASNLDSEDNASLAIPEGLAMDPLSPSAMVLSTDFMDRIGNGLSLLKDHGKKVQKYMWKNTKFEILKKSWSSVVNVVLIEARDLPDSPPGGSNGVYCKFRLGTEMYKSKQVLKTAQPAWRERFNMHLYEDKRLELTMWHKGKQKNFMGRCTIDLSQLEKDRTHNFWQPLECGFGSVHLLLTLSGSSLSVPCDGIPTTYTNGSQQQPLESEKYAWYNLGGNEKGISTSVVGELRVTVHGARGLPLSSLGKCPLVLCVLELDNARVQTHAARASPDPLWNQTYKFEVMDITSTLDVAVSDQSIITQLWAETIGTVSIPLLRINNGEKRWYALKDKTKKATAKGNCPRILLEMNIVWNPIKASLRVLSPRETKFVQKRSTFDIPLIYNNLKFIKEVFNSLYELNEFIKEVFEWDSLETCTVALVTWLTVCYFFRLWMAPLALLTPFLYNYATRRSSCANNSLVPIEYTEYESDEVSSDAEKDDKTIKNRLNSLQDLTFTIKNGIDYIVSLAERIKNLTNFTVPYLSILAMVMLLVCSVALYIIPINYLFMALGIYKFMRKLLNPERILNNDLLDFISRIPDNEILKEWRELKVPEPTLTRIGSRRRPRS